MPRLRTCYFCGAVGDSLQEYDLVPEGLVDPDRSHSAVLCSTCHEKLRRVLEPLVEAAESSDPTTPQAGSLPEVTFESDATSTDGDERGADPDITESDADGSRNGERNDAETAADESGGEDMSTDDGSVDDVSADPSDAAPDGTTADAATDGEAPDGSSGTDESDLPDDYYKVLRLLQNREFPMERDDLTALVTSAYDVSPPQCERILETAVERGVLVEDGSTIDLGRN